MPVLIASLIGALAQAASTLAGRALVAFGLGVVTFSGVSSLVDVAKTAAFSQLDKAAAVSQVGQYMGLLQVGTCVNIWFSAYLVRLALNGLTNGSIKRWVTK
ncbi:MAG: DUF2523 family protein [Aquabacterium sp.]|uniref:DUF2523 family protein n=1 Tax=Aquabacterium sp. TaxID=1872578 RepID=UPI003BCCB867